MDRPAWFCHQWSLGTPPGYGTMAKGLFGSWHWYMWPGRQQRASMLAQPSYTGVSQHPLRIIYIVSFQFSFSGGSLSGLLSHPLRENSSQHLEDSLSMMGTSDMSNHLCLGAPCHGDAFCNNHSFAHLLHPPFGIPVLIAPVIPGNRNMDH